MNGEMPRWMTELDEEDRQFLKRFLLCSGSLKDLAEQYSVSYPTLRARLDRLIAKVQVADEEKVVDPLERKLKLLVADGQISIAVARDLIKVHRESLAQRSKS